MTGEEQKGKKIKSNLVQKSHEIIRQMEKSNFSIVESTETLEKTLHQYETYDSVLSVATASLKHLKKMAETDAKYLKMAWMIFMLISLYIFLKRTGILWIIMTTIKTFIWSSSYSLGFLGKLLEIGGFIGMENNIPLAHDEL